MFASHGQLELALALLQYAQAKDASKRNDVLKYVHNAEARRCPLAHTPHADLALCFAGHHRGVSSWLRNDGLADFLEEGGYTAVETRRMCGPPPISLGEGPKYPSKPSAMAVVRESIKRREGAG